MYCPNCGYDVKDDAVICINCGYKLNQPKPKKVSHRKKDRENTNEQTTVFNGDTNNVSHQKSRILAGVLNMLFPGVGRLYLGHIAKGILELLVGILFFGYIWSFIDGIMIIVTKNQVDGKGVPVK